MWMGCGGSLSISGRIQVDAAAEVEEDKGSAAAAELERLMSRERRKTMW